MMQNRTRSAAPCKCYYPTYTKQPYKILSGKPPSSSSSSSSSMNGNDNIHMNNPSTPYSGIPSISSPFMASPSPPPPSLATQISPVTITNDVKSSRPNSLEYLQYSDLQHISPNPSISTRRSQMGLIIADLAREIKILMKLRGKPENVRVDSDISERHILNILHILVRVERLECILDEYEEERMPKGRLRGVAIRTVGLARISLNSILKLIGESVYIFDHNTSNNNKKVIRGNAEQWQIFLSSESSRYDRLATVLIEKVGGDVPAFLFLIIQYIRQLESFVGGFFGVQIEPRARSSHPWVPPGSAPGKRLRQSDALVSGTNCDGFLIQRESDRSVAVLRRCRSSRMRPNKYSAY